GGGRQVLSQPRAGARDGARGARGCRDRLGARRRRHAGGAAAGGAARRQGGRVVTGLTNEQILLSPVVSEKSYSGIAEGRYTFKVHPDAHRTQVRQAVEDLFDVHGEDRESGVAGK